MKANLFQLGRWACGVVLVGFALFISGCDASDGSTDGEFHFKNESSRKVTLSTSWPIGDRYSTPTVNTLQPGQSITVKAPDLYLRYDYEPKATVKSKELGDDHIVFINKT